MKKAELFSPRDAVPGVCSALRGYPTIKQWIYKGRLITRKTPGGHHRIPATELDKLLPRTVEKSSARSSFRRVSGRNQLVGRIVDIKNCKDCSHK